MKAYMVCYKNYMGDTAYHSTVYFSKKKAEEAEEKFDWSWIDEVEVDIEM